MSKILKEHPEVRTISIKMDTGNFSRVGTIVDEIPATLPCERSGCGERFNLLEYLREAIRDRREEGKIYHCCPAMQKMNRTDYRECLAQLHGSYKIEYYAPVDGSA